MEDQHSNSSPAPPRHPEEWQAKPHQSCPIVIQQGTAIGAEGHLLAWTRYASLHVGIRCEPPLVLVHGAAHQGAIFDTWAREIAHYGVIVYALDMRGHGRSSMPPVSRCVTRICATTWPMYARWWNLSMWRMGGLCCWVTASAAP